MEIVLLFLVAFVPVIIYANFVFKKDTNKEPKELLRKLFMGGILSVILTLVLTEVLSTVFPILGADYKELNLLQLSIYVYAGIALIEELSKWFFAYLIGFNNVEFDETFDGVVYCAYVSLGFAFLENLLYLIGNPTFTIGFFRSITSIPAHLCNGIFMGYFFGLAKNDKKNKNIYLLLSVIIPTLLHGTYDYIIFSSIDNFIILFFIYVVILFTSSLLFINKLSTNNITFKKIKKSIFNFKYCNRCGNKVRGKYCSKCGNKVN